MTNATLKSGSYKRNSLLVQALGEAAFRVLAPTTCDRRAAEVQLHPHLHRGRADQQLQRGLFDRRHRHRGRHQGHGQQDGGH